MEGGASHQAWVIVVALGEPFCIANDSNFALWLSVCQGQTRRVGRFSQASLLAWMNITTWLQGRKPRESNKLFDLFYRRRTGNGLSLFIALARMVTFCKEGDGMLLVWALRARSYETRAES